MYFIQDKKNSCTMFAASKKEESFIVSSLKILRKIENKTDTLRIIFKQKNNKK